MTLWYLARAAGVVMLVCFTASICLGASASVRVRANDASWRERRLLVQYFHRAAAITGFLLIFVHVAALVADGKSGISVSGALIPLTAGYRPLALALGSVAAYLFVFVAIVGAGRRHFAASAAGARRWRTLHAASYVAWSACVLHGVLTGTDAGKTWMTAITLTCVAAVVICVGVRIGSELHARRGPLARGRRRLALQNGRES